MIEWIARVDDGRDDGERPEQLILPPQPPSASRTRTRTIPSPEQAARVYIARRAKPSVVPGHVKLTLTLERKRELAERLSAMAIRTDQNIEALVIELLAKGVGT